MSVKTVQRIVILKSEQDVYQDDIVEELFAICESGTRNQIKSTIDELLTCYACSSDTLAMFKELIFEDLIDARRLSDAYWFALEYDLSPGALNNVLLQSACEHGVTELVVQLLNHPLVDPAEHDNASLMLAVENGHIEVVILLLNDDRVDPCANDHAFFDSSTINGYHHILQLLLDHTRHKHRHCD